MSKDLLGQDAHEKNAVLKLQLQADSGYTANGSYRASPAQYTAVKTILEQPRPHHTHESGMEASLLFTAHDSSANKDVVVYAYQADDGKTYFATCPLDEWQDEFSKVDNQN